LFFDITECAATYTGNRKKDYVAKYCEKCGAFVGIMLPLAESVISLYLLVKEGDRGANAYGADPLEGQH